LLPYFRGNHEVLRDFTDEEVGLLVDLLTRLIANLDRVTSVEASPGTPIFEKETDRNVRRQAD
jgi:MarR family transcriptional regulator, transcriptional regulator for hemolysin